jgi:hypothetical protein
MSPRRLNKTSADAGNLGSIPLDKKKQAEFFGETDPLILAAQMFQPRTTDSFGKWLQEKCGAYLNPAQEMINDSIVRNRYTAVPSCHSAGKSFLSAAKVGHFIDSHAIGSAFVVSTAPTSAQIESVLWRELGRIHAKANLRGRITRSGYPQWRIGDELIAYGRRPTEMSSFQGLHARFILIILDEADGIPEELWLAADTLASSGHVRVLAIGNPDSADSHFAKVIRPGSGWNVVRIDGLRTPNMTRAGVAPFPELGQYMRDHGIPFSDQAIAHVPAQVRSEWRDVLLSPEWVYERMQRWGVTRFVDEKKVVRWREPALWMSKVRGVSPTEGSEGVIPLSWVERAMNRWTEWELAGKPKVRPDGSPWGREIYGCDVADTGRDETVTTTRFGHIIAYLDRVSQQNTDTTSKRLAGKLMTTADSIAAVDGAGIGAGVVNQLRGLRLPVFAFIGASSADGMRDITNEFTFNNKRSAAYWHLRELLDPINGPDDLMLPPDEDLKTDLTVPKWSVKTGAVIQVEPKELVSKRLKRSPDCGDSVVISFWLDSAPEMKVRIHERVDQFDEMAEDWGESNNGLTPWSGDGTGALERAKERMLKLGAEDGKRKSNHVFGYAQSRTSEWDTGF